MDPIYRLPPDWALEASLTPLAELVEPYKELAGVPELQASGDGGEGELVAILDTGVDMNHPDLKDNLVDAADFTNSFTGPRDVQGHGSWCCSAICASANDTGIRGIAHRAKYLSAKVLGDNGSGNDQTIAKGLKWAYDRGARVFSLSLGGPSMSEWLHGLFREVSKTPGCFIFCAAGNDGGKVNYPGAWNEVISVGAVDGAGQLTQFTSRGPELDVLAPGVQLIGAVPGGYARMTGTSMATPLAAGVATLIKAAYRRQGTGDLLDSLYEMLHLLMETGKQVGDYRLLDPRKLSIGVPTTPLPTTTPVPVIITTPPPPLTTPPPVIVTPPPVLPPPPPTTAPPPTTLPPITTPPPGGQLPPVGVPFPFAGTWSFAGGSYEVSGTMKRRF